MVRPATSRNERMARFNQSARWWLVVSLLVFSFMFGGASRLDVQSLLILQPLAVLCAVALLLTPGPFDWRAVRFPLLFLGILAALMVAQLLPLPPALWTALPGHGQFANVAVVAAVEQPWRPISLTPDLTLASLVGLVVPFAALVAFASLDQRRRRLLLLVILGGVAVSALFGLAQVSGGRSSPFYTYRITNLGNAVGLFANRNHQAALLAMAGPMLATWAIWPRENRHRGMVEKAVAAGFGIFLVPLLLVTGSRAGLALGMLSIVFGVLMWRSSRGPRSPEMPGSKFAVIGVAAAAGLVICATVLLSRAEAVSRVLDIEAGGDLRIVSAPTLLQLAQDFFPVGAGFGGFDPLFRVYEPDSLLNPAYFNHAHNDLAELVITGGLPAILLLAGFLAWFASATWKVWRQPVTATEHLLARLGSQTVALLLAASLVDYPLRTPLMMVLFAIACCWLSAGAADRAPTSPPPRHQ